jgi:SAM-dependent methyltransferase
MRYVKAPAETIPFPDNHFDVVSSFNSLDHVDDLDTAVREVCRVVKPGGLLLLLTDVNHEPTITEPITLTWDVVDRFTPPLHVLDVRRYEKDSSGMYASLVSGTPYDDADLRPRYGILSALLSK